MGRVVQRGTDTVILDDSDNEVLIVSATGKLTTGDVTPAAVADLTGAFGTTGSAIGDVTAAFSQTILNNNFRVLEDKVNVILAAIRSAGIIA